MFFGRDIIDSFALRTVFLFASTTFSIFVVMFLVGIITVDDIVNIFGITDPHAVTALKNVAGRMSEMTKNILDILSKLLNQMFGWTGTDIDLSKIKIDTGNGGIVPANAPANSPTGVGK